MHPLAIEARQQFFAEHGECIMSEGHWVFCDGSLAEDNEMGRLCPPPTDDYQRSKLIERFYHLRAQMKEREFDEFKLYLNGTGNYHIRFYTDEEKLEHLEELKILARRAKQRYYKAKRDREALTPEYLRNIDSTDAEQRQRRQEFLTRVESVRI